MLTLDTLRSAARTLRQAAQPAEEFEGEPVFLVYVDPGFERGIRDFVARHRWRHAWKLARIMDRGDLTPADVLRRFAGA